MIRTYKYRLQPNRKQRIALQRTLDICRDLFNLCLEQKRMQRTHWVEQSRQLTKLKVAFPEYNAVHRHVLGEVIRKLHRSFENMWNSGAGYPRFKSYRRYNSFKFGRIGFKLVGRYIHLSKIGAVKIHLSREIPSGAAVKTMIVKKTVSGWYGYLVVDIPPTPLPPSSAVVGIDLGIENLAAMSDGTMVRNPQFYVSAQAELRRAQRRVARRKKGSHGRYKAVVLLAKIQDRIHNRRLDWAHKATTELIAKFGTLVIENLNVKALARGVLAKQVNDAAWGQFVSLLKYKAESAGRRIVQVDARHTSQDCPVCGHRKKKSLSERQHKCSKCGYTAHRDTAAAQVIRARTEPLDANEGEVTPCVV